MSVVRENHDIAMGLAYEADLSTHPADKRYLYEQAQRHEQRAAESLDAIAVNEPTRSILWRSASALANSAAHPVKALDCATRGLEGIGVSPEIRGELLDEIERAVNLLREEEMAK